VSSAVKSTFLLCETFGSFAVKLNRDILLLKKQENGKILKGSNFLNYPERSRAIGRNSGKRTTKRFRFLA
jgi:hypothetical protein